MGLIKKRSKKMEKELRLKGSRKKDTR